MFWGKVEISEVPVVGKAIVLIGMIPLKRGSADMRSIKESANALKAGNALLVFVEGHRSKDGKTQEGKAGAALLSRLTGAPILPCAIVCGKRQLFSRMKINFGEPITAEQLGVMQKGADINSATQTIMSHINALLEI
jgi:1-acyl-sn-glycerol-3-phosphate acyltransferase